MRAIELYETGLTKTELKKHDGKYMDRVLEKVRNGETFELEGGLGDIVIDKEQYPEIESFFNAIRNKEPTLQSFKVRDVEGNYYAIGKLRKTADIKGDTISDINRGYIGEGLAAAAVAARLAKKGHLITEEDVMDIWDNMETEILPPVGKKKTAIGVGKWSPDRVGGVWKTMIGNDTLKLVIGLALPEFRFLTEPEAKDSKEVKSIIKSVVKYVNNSKTIIEILKYIQDDEAPNLVEVKGIGYEDQKGTKADLITTIDGEAVKKAISLKTGKQIFTFGQKYGATHKAFKEFYANALGIDLPDSYKMYFDEDPYKGTIESHNFFYTEIKRLLAGASDAQEARFVDRLADGVKHYATGGQDLNVVILGNVPSKAEFKELNFRDLAPKMANVDLDVGQTGKENSTIDIFDKNIGHNKAGILVRYRLKSDDKAGTKRRNYIEMGDRLKDLTAIPQLDQEEK